MPHAKHTAGPYEIADDIINEHGNLIGIYIRKRDNGMVGQVFSNCLVKKEETLRANARLLAAAPELLKAAMTVLAGLNARIDQAASADLPIPVFKGIADLHAAIAKATA